MYIHRYLYPDRFYFSIFISSIPFFMLKSSIKILSHISIWAVILVIITLMPLMPEESFSLKRSFPFTVTYLYLVCFFYLNANYLTVKLISNKKYLSYIIYTAVLLVLYVYFHKYIISLFFQFRDFPLPREGMKGPPPMQNIEKMISFRQIILPFSQFFLFWILSSCYRLVLEWLSANKKNKEIEAEKSVIELSYLKAQINPHFIFSTLNTIYSLTLNRSDKASEAILLYSEIIRYVFDKIDTDRVPLQEEIDYITNYINLQSLRFTDTLDIEFETKGNIEDHRIAPLIFISFIENAFQYGISNHYHSTISFRIEASDDGICFMSRNMIYKRNEFKHIGKNIGIDNTKRKLNLIYPDKHRLVIREINDSFCLELAIFDTLCK